MASSPHLFLFTGDDSFSIHEKVNFWIEQFRKKYGAGKTVIIDGSQPSATPLVAQLKNQLQSNSLFSTTTLVIAKHLSKNKAWAEIKDYLIEYLPKTSEKTFFVLQEDVIEKKDLVYKAFAALEKEGNAKIENFPSLEGDTLKKWIAARQIRYGLTITPALANYLVARLDPPSPAWPPQKKKIDLWKINSHLIKLAAYSKSVAITKEIVDDFVAEESTTTSFDIIDTLLAGNLARTLIMLHKTIDEDGASIKSDLIGLMNLLTRQLKEFITIKEMSDHGASDDQIANQLGWQTKRIWVVKKKIASKSHADLVRMAADVSDLEQSIKFTSGNPLTILDQYLMKMK